MMDMPVAAAAPGGSTDTSGSASVWTPLRLRRRVGTELDGLNLAQREAAATIDGPVMVLAGAGTGKTTLLIQRTALLVSVALVPPPEIMCVTFKTDAAGEFKERLARYLGDEMVKRMPMIGTFHALSLRLLADRPEIAGLRRWFRVLDDPKRLVAEALKRLAGDPAGAAGSDAARDGDHPAAPAMNGILRAILAAPSREIVEAVSEQIQRMKGLGMTPDDVGGAGGRDPNSVAAGGEIIPEILAEFAYPLYQAMLREGNLADFGDLMMFPVIAMRNDPALARRWGARIRVAQADEYQDTSGLQFEWLRLLVGDRHRPGHRCLAVVGDDDQNLYSWRGATPENISQFTHHYPDARIVRLEENYRNPVEIIEAANALIANNQRRMTKVLRVADSRRVDGELPSQGPIPLLEFRNEDAEAAWVAAEAEAAYRAGQTVSIIYRINALSRPFEEALMRRGVPYRLNGTQSFWSRGVVQDVLAYARLFTSLPEPAAGADGPSFTDAALHELAAAFERVSDRPARRIGDVTVKQILDRAAADRVHPLVAALAMADAGELRSDTAAGVREWKAAFERAAAPDPVDGEDPSLPLPPANPGAGSPSELLARILYETGYSALVAGEEDAEDHVRDIVHYAGRYGSLAAMLESIDTMLRRAAEARKAVDKDATPVPLLMTAHGAKGLEFDRVFMPAWEEGLVPHQKAIDGDGIEEERRIAFVKLTRVRGFGSVSHVRYRRGAAEPSRFLDELPGHVVVRREVRPAAAKQLAYAIDIAQALDLAAPNGHDADAVSAFIAANQARFLAGAPAKRRPATSGRSGQRRARAASSAAGGGAQ